MRVMCIGLVLLVSCSGVLASSTIKYTDEMYTKDMTNMISSLGRIYSLCKSKGIKKACDEAQSLSRVMSVLAGTKAAESWGRDQESKKIAKSKENP